MEKILQEKVENEVELKKYIRICQDLTEKQTDSLKKIERVSKGNVELEVNLRHVMHERDNYKSTLADLEKRFEEMLVEKLEAEVTALKYKADRDEQLEKCADLEKKMGQIVAEKLFVEVDSKNRIALATEDLDKVRNEKEKEIEKLRSEVVRLSHELEKEKRDRNEAVTRLNAEISGLFNARDEALESAKHLEDKCRLRLSKLEEDVAAFLRSDQDMTRRVKDSASVQILLGDKAASPEFPASGPDPSDVVCGDRIPIQNQDLHRSGPTETAINHAIMIECDDDTPVNSLSDVPVIETVPALMESNDRKRPQCNNGGGSQYKKSKVVAENADVSVLPQRPSEPPCGFYTKTGHCIFGASCKFYHPKNIVVPSSEQVNGTVNEEAFKIGNTAPLQQVATPALLHNSKGLPVRPGEVDCPFYLKTGSCKYGATCRYNHPDIYAINPTAAGAAFATTPAAQFNMGLNPAASVIQSIDPRFTQPTLGLGTTIYPQRPGTIECDYYMKNGECKFGERCKFHHPINRLAPTQLAKESQQEGVKLTLAGLPRREGAVHCPYYMKTGACKYGASCRFDHPPPGEVMTLATTAASAAEVQEHTETNQEQE